MKESYASLYIDRNERGYAIGLAIFEPYGVSGWLFERNSDPTHPFGAVDEVLHLLFVAQTPRLIIGAASIEYFQEIEENFNPFMYDYCDKQFEIEEQNTLFLELFALRSLFSPIEHLSLDEKPLASSALALIADHCRQRRWSGYALPRWLDMSEIVCLGNNALAQLEMVTFDPHMSSISKLLLTMITPMGKRLGRFWLFLPIHDRLELENRYDWIEWIRPHEAFFKEHLNSLSELERIWWSIQNAKTEEAEWFLNHLSTIEKIQVYTLRHQPKLSFFDDFMAEGWLLEWKNRLHERHWVKMQIPRLHQLIDWIARLDVALSQALNSDRYGLVRPTIIESDERFIQCNDLRHLLVEAQGIKYVANDIVMGNRDFLDVPYPSTVMLDSTVHDGAHIRGVLLYGINSSGKSSLMKSIGIAVVLAQGGFFVPAKVMRFSLFDAIFTRIQSRDNVAKSLSTFGVEMLELNAVFTRATSRSLVLGDEISHGTETLSAVSIVAATVLELEKKGCLFLMTTHLHQLSMIPELSRLRDVVHLHLGVRFDEEHDRLIYDRILKSGRGSSIYGLEFAESLHMNPNFLLNASRLRESLAKEYDLLELGNHKEYLKRYREVVACECVICGALIRNTQKNIHAKEHHHLIPLCDTHAKAIAQDKIKPRGFIITSQGLRFEYETQLV